MLLLLLPGCAGGVTPAPTSPAHRWEPRLQAGVARADLTPPPGLSLFGHGPEGRVSVGVLLRLYCDVFVFTSGTEAVALAPCDLGAMSTELQRAVAQRVISAGVPLGADRIFLMATHTHAGPAHFLGSRQYADSGFSSMDPGFDPKVCDFLAARIAAAIQVAYAKREDARVAWASDLSGRGLTRNRSFVAWAANKQDAVCPAAPSSPAVAATAPPEPERFSPAQLAVDPTLSVLRVDRVLPPARRRDGHETEPMGVLAVFGVHNTGISNTNDLYHSDIFGFAVRELEELIAVDLCAAQPAGAAGDEAHLTRCRTDWRSVFPEPPVLAGIANGIEGDVSPTVDFQAPREARRIGESLARRIYHLYRTAEPLLADQPVERAYRELWLPGAQAALDAPRGEAPPHLCDAPELGTAAAGGAPDGPTWLRVMPAMNAGIIAPSSNGCQGLKLPLIAPGGARFSGDGLDFPNVVPIGLVRVGGRLLAMAPGELTTSVGTRIRDELEGIHTDKWGKVVVVGLTNAYLQYVTTAAEYPLQQYEAASTLYGPEEASFFRLQLRCLAAWMASDGRDERSCPPDQRFGFNRVYPTRYGAATVSRMPQEPEDLPETVEIGELSTELADRDQEPGWLVRFRGIPGGVVQLRERLRVRIVAEDGRLIDDDRGSGMELRYQDTGSDGGWTARWVPGYWEGHPLKGSLCHGTNVHFEVTSTTRVVSRPFEIRCRRLTPQEQSWQELDKPYWTAP